LISPQQLEKTVIDCSTADLSRDLLETKNKEQLLEKVRLSEERSNELATPSLVTKSAHLGTFIKKRASSETTAIILITYPNPFRDSLRSLQAKTFALFNKDAAVLSCKKSNRKVEMRSLQLLS